MGRKVIAVSTYNAVASPHTLTEDDSAPDGYGTGMDVTSGKLISHRVSDGHSLSPVTGPQSSNIFTLCALSRSVGCVMKAGYLIAGQQFQLRAAGQALCKIHFEALGVWPAF